MARILIQRGADVNAKVSLRRGGCSVEYNRRNHRLLVSWGAQTDDAGRGGRNTSRFGYNDRS